ncbi:MAG TPA: response regulator [Gemmatimonadaceae bacterium]|nr:response regulator [Gemmatimonadaceae bacterium]
MRRKKILVVDDSATSVMWQTLILRNGPYEVRSAKDGQAGVEAAAAEPPDLVLMDVIMPRMNGFEACAAIRKADATRDVPIIMVTTRSEMASVEQGFVSGCTEYITKPIDRTELLAKVKSYLGE